MVAFSIILPDQTLAELAFGDSLSGPGDCFGRLHCNTSAVFCRINGCIWKHTIERSMYKARLWLEACENIEDAKELLEKE